MEKFGKIFFFLFTNLCMIGRREVIYVENLFRSVVT